MSNQFSTCSQFIGRCIVVIPLTFCGSIAQPIENCKTEICTQIGPQANGRNYAQLAQKPNTVSQDPGNLQGEFEIAFERLRRVAIDKSKLEQTRSDALKLLEKFANEGYEGAQFRVGQIYYDRKDIGNIEIAIRWWESLANSGIPRAHLALGNLYAEGNHRRSPEGRPWPDDERAIQHYQNAVKLGSPSAKVRLARTLLKQNSPDCQKIGSLLRDMLEPRGTDLANESNRVLESKEYLDRCPDAGRNVTKN